MTLDLARWRRLAHRLALAVMLAAPSTVGASESGDSPLPAATARAHAWFVSPEPVPAPGGDLQNRPLVHHHARDMAIDAYTYGPSLLGPVEALAAHGVDLWLVLPPDPVARRPNRQVLTCHITRIPETGTDMVRPGGNQLEVLPQLDGLGRLVGLAGTPRGPVALLLPEQRAHSTVEAGDDAIAAAPALRRPMLMRLEFGAWTEIELPAPIPAGVAATVFTGGPDGRALVLLVEDPADSSSCTMYTADATDAWTSSRLALGLDAVRQFVWVESHHAVAAVSCHDGDLSIGLLTPPEVVPIASVAAPAGRWGVIGLGDGLAIVSWSTAGGLLVRRVEVQSGSVGAPMPMRHETTPLSRWIHVPILFGVAVIMVIIVFLVRGGSGPMALDLPPGGQLLAPMPRLLALMIDLAPATIAMVLVYHQPLQELIVLPFQSTDLHRSIPAILIVGLTMAHSVAGEVVSGRSLGKWAVGARIALADGRRPSTWAVLARNVGKLVVLLVPPLALFTLFNPHLQGIGDVLARTVVVQDPRKPDGDEPVS